MGESQTWNLTGYEVMITPENFKAGNGTLIMKSADEYITDSFQFKTHAVIFGEDTVVHAGAASGAEINIAKKTIGAIEGGAYLNKNADPITLKNISEIYMIVEWWDMGKNKSVKERIDLYKHGSKEQTFLN